MFATARGTALVPGLTYCTSKYASWPTPWGTMAVGSTQCAQCARRAPPEGAKTMLMPAPEFVRGECPKRIEEKR